MSVPPNAAGGTPIDPRIRADKCRRIHATAAFTTAACNESAGLFRPIRAASFAGSLPRLGRKVPSRIPQRRSRNVMKKATSPFAVGIGSGRLEPAFLGVPHLNPDSVLRSKKTKIERHAFAYPVIVGRTLRLLWSRD
jgi:hypothetical protein